MADLILVRGLPGSGKSTLAKRLAADSEDCMLHVETDEYFVGEDGAYNFNAALLPTAHAWCQESARAALDSGRSVIVSNTFTQKWEMAPYVKMAELGGHVLGIVICCGIWQSCHDVPEAAILRMRDRWENVTVDELVSAYRYEKARMEMAELEEDACEQAEAEYSRGY